MPLVTVVCICYNQARYVAESVESVLRQTYKHIELIIVNDASTDDSNVAIEALIDKYPQIKYINNQFNQGICKSFNNALEISKGAFFIDLAADDILVENRIEKQVKVFEHLDPSWGVVFSDAWLVDMNGKKLKTFYKRNTDLKLQENVISGDVFTKVVERYQICTPTIMIRRSVFDELGGYDPKLSYEDYDFFIRSSRKYKYYFMEEILTLKREVKGSGGKMFYNRNRNPHLVSTLTVLKKYLWLCKSQEETEASLHSIRYHMRQALFMECYELTRQYFGLIQDLNKVTFQDRLVYFLSLVKFPLNIFYGLYRRFFLK